MNLLDRFSKSTKIRFHENLSSGSRIVPRGRTDRRTGKQTNVKNLIASFRNFSKPAKNKCEGLEFYSYRTFWSDAVSKRSQHQCMYLCYGFITTWSIGSYEEFISKIGNKKRRHSTEIFLSSSWDPFSYLIPYAAYEVLCTVPLGSDMPDVAIYLWLTFWLLRVTL